jgi:hypothetical protein
MRFKSEQVELALFPAFPFRLPPRLVSAFCSLRLLLIPSDSKSSAVDQLHQSDLTRLQLSVSGFARRASLAFDWLLIISCELN